MGTVVHDLRYSLRMLAKNRWFALLCVLTLALGLGFRRAVATSLVIITITGLAALASHLATGARPDPAVTAALAGSTKIPSFCASQLCAARMSSSLTTSIAPRDSKMAARACFQLAGFPILIAEAIVSGLSIMLS